MDSTLHLNVASYKRLFTYTALIIVVMAYQYAHHYTWNQLILFPLIAAILYLLNSLISYKNQCKYRHLAKFIIDCGLFFIALACVDYNLIIALWAFIAFFFSLSFQYYYAEKAILLISLFCPVIYIKTTMPIVYYWQALDTPLVVIYVFLLALYSSISIYTQVKYIQQLKKDKQSYYQSLTHYIGFANQLSRYAPTQLWQSIIRGEAKAEIEYKRKHLTIFFSDIQGFTQLSDTLLPEDLAYLLNEYFSYMTQIAQHYNATIDKFMGDGMLIFFGDPHSNGTQHDAKSCIQMALAMREQMTILRHRWQSMGYPELHIRMGITTGHCHVGNYGTSERMAYTIIGREVNLASRIQDCADVDEILISDHTYQLVQHDFLCLKKAAIQVKGIANPVSTWQILAEAPTFSPNQDWLDYEYQGIRLKLSRLEWEQLGTTQFLQQLAETLYQATLQNQPSAKSSIEHH